MSAAEELAAELARIRGLLADVQTAVVMAQSQWEGCEQALAVFQGTADPEAAQLVAEHQQVADALVAAWQRIGQARENVENYRTLVGVADAVTASGPSIPHPSTRGRVPADAARNRSWVDRVRERLPEWKGGQTTGFGYDRDGNELYVTSGRDEHGLSDQARLILHNSDQFATDDRGEPTVTAHVEVKFALMMRRSGQTRGVIVLNNAVCKGCRDAVPAVLPRGSSLAVWQPGASTALDLKGEARP